MQYNLKNSVTSIVSEKNLNNILKNESIISPTKLTNFANEKSWKTK